MSRNYRGRQVGKRHDGTRIRPLSNDEIARRIAAQIKRDAIKRGIIPDRSQQPPRYKFTWRYGNIEGVVYANTRSEARAMIKRDLGIKKKKRLPIEVEIEREPNEDSTLSFEESQRSNDYGREVIAAI